MPAGTRVEFMNFDSEQHNVYSLTPGSDFDLKKIKKGDSGATTLTEPGVVQIYCNIHPWMQASLLVVPNAWFVEGPPSSGPLELPLPAGTYDLVAWAPNHELQPLRVVVPAGGTVEVTFDLVATPFEPRTDKHGQLFEYDLP